MAKKITFQGNPLTLSGEVVKVGERAPQFKVVDKNLQEVELKDLSAKILVLVSVPSLDTPVCDLEARRFNQEALTLGEEVEIALISMDLPFAQARWCGNLDKQRLNTYSDYRYASFGKEFGVLIKELHLLARAIFILNEKREVVYVQLVEEITKEPDYKEVLDKIKELI